MMKTIKEAAIEYANVNYDFNETWRAREVCPQAFKAGVEYAQQWISVEDRLPKTSFIGKTKYGGIDIYHTNDKAVMKVMGITHWRYIELK